jgi:hypothetical protein
MTTLREAAQQALGALEELNGWQSLAPPLASQAGRQAAINLRAALEQPEQPEPEQEPTSQLKPNATTRLQDPGAYDRGVLTGLRQALAICSDWEDFTADRLAGDIQDAINNQMALEQPEQEPLFVVEGGELRPLRPALLNDGDKLYTHPPRRETEPAAFDALVAISLLTHLGGEVAEYADVVEAVRRLHALNGELLKTLKWLDRWLGGKPMTECSSRILEAIAKAEGKV